MNKIIIIGHPHSRYQDVEQLLQQCGMHGAQPSRREGHSPAEIAAMLCKAHGVEPLNAAAGQELLTQIEAAPVWHGLALDLMLGNMERNFWGWADPLSVHLLDYWSQLDPAIKFVLVYSDPESVMLHAPSEAEREDPAAIEQRIGSWMAFNQTLLHFYHRNPQRCVLVHSEQVRRSVEDYLQQIRVRLEAPVMLPQGSTQGQASQSAAPGMPDEPAKAPNATPVGTDDAAHPGNGHAALHRIIAGRALEQFPLALQTFQDLQASANLPLDDAASPLASTFEAWVQLWRELESADSQTPSLEHRPMEDLEEENELLLLQLHQVQEELEHYYLELQSLKNGNGAEPPKNAAAAPAAHAAVHSSTHAAPPPPDSGLVARLRKFALSSHYAKLIAASGEFDSEWYVRAYPDVAAHAKFATRPALHYVMHGAAEERDPSPRFSTSRYLALYPDVRASGLNPLVHYIKHGKQEGRLA